MYEHETQRITYPPDLMRAAHRPRAGLLESTAHDLVHSLECYAREKPAAVTLWAFAFGLVLGWKLKP